MESYEIRAKADEISMWLEGAVGDVATAYYQGYSFDPKWEEKVKGAKEDGVIDVEGWLADEVYNDVATIRALIGDRISDAAHPDEEAMVAIATEMKEGAHTALVEALDGFIKDHSR